MGAVKSLEVHTGGTVPPAIVYDLDIILNGACVDAIGIEYGRMRGLARNTFSMEVAMLKDFL